MRLNSCLKLGLFSNVSIHASVKDATGLTTYETVSVNVSIHASVKDATTGYDTGTVRFKGFNPRICKRCDRKDEILSNPSLVSIHASVKDATLKF